MHRFLIVIEKADGNYSACRRTCLAASQPARPAIRRRGTYMQPLTCMCAGCWKTSCRCPSPVHLPSMLLYPYD